MRRDYQIRKINASDKYLFFHLTDAVSYSDKKASYITLLNKPSLSIYKVGDIISIEYVMVKKISRIIYADKTPYEKKIALFNFLKDLELGELEEDKNKKINLLLLGRVYNELAKQNLREYKKLEGDSQNEIK